LYFYIISLIFTIFRPILKFVTHVEQPHYVYYRPLYAFFALRQWIRKIRKKK